MNNYLAECVYYCVISKRGCHPFQPQRTRYPTMSTRTYAGHVIGHRQLDVRHWIGGHGYVYTPMVELWNPAHPERRIVLTQHEFIAITSPATAQAA